MTPSAFLLILSAFFGSPRAALYFRILSALSHLSPCPVSLPACPALHQRAAMAIAIVASEAEDVDDAAARLLGIAIHETGARELRQREGGSARSFFQVEPVGVGPVRLADAARLEADPVYAARRALALSGDLDSYACGKRRPCDVARELRRYVDAARWAMGR